MGEELVALELLDDRSDAVVATDSQVVALGDVVGECDARTRAEAREHSEQHVAFERLCLVDDDEGVVEGTAANVGQREDFEDVAVHDLVDDVLGHQAFERVEDGLRPRAHLLGLGAREVAEFLAAHRVERAEDDDASLLAALEHGLKPGA